MDKIEETFSRHKKAALMFSGGKDSLMTLILLKDFWDQMTVIWVNTGNVFPENEKIVRRWAAKVPHFLEVKTDVNKYKQEFGLPTDLLVTKNTHLAEAVLEKTEQTLISGFDCCANNLWFPAMQAIKDIGATLVIRGQRNDEAAKSQIRSGHIQDGIEYFFPIEEWTQERVLNELRRYGVRIPKFFHFAESSLDCMNCTAFLSGIADRRKWMEKYHPKEHQENQRNLETIYRIADAELTSAKKSACLK